jgi:hypothetical protein
MSLKHEIIALDRSGNEFFEPGKYRLAPMTQQASCFGADRIRRLSYDHVHRSKRKQHRIAGFREQPTEINRDRRG